MHRILVVCFVLAAVHAWALDCVDWSESLLPPVPIQNLETGLVVSAGEWLVVADATLRVYDASAPTSPVLIGSVPLPESPRRLRCFGSEVFVACGASGLLRLDLAQPGAPTLHTVLAPGGTVNDVALGAGIALVITAEGDLFIVDDPFVDDEPVVGSIELDTDTHCAVIAGQDAIVATYSGFIAIDLSSPEVPVPGEFQKPWNQGSVNYCTVGVQDMVVEDTTLNTTVTYTCNDVPYPWIATIDISDPHDMVMVAREASPSGGLARIGDLVFIAGGDRLGVFGVSYGFIVGRFPLHESITSLALHRGTDLFISGEDRVFHVDVSDPRCIQPHAVALEGEDYYMGDRFRYLVTSSLVGNPWEWDSYWVHDCRIYDMAGAPDLVWNGFVSEESMGIGYNPEVLEVVDQTLVLGHISAGLEFHHLLDGQWEFTGGRSHLAVDGSLHWTREYSTSRVIVSDCNGVFPPIDLNSFEIPLNPWSAIVGEGFMLFRSGDQFWAATYIDGSLDELSLVDLDSPSYGQATLHANGLYLVTDDHGLVTYNYTDPTSPRDLGRLDCALTLRRLSVDDGVMVVGGDEGFQVFAVASGGSPQAMSSIIDHQHSDLTVTDEHLLVSDEVGGVTLYDLSDPTMPMIVGVAHGSSAENPFVDGDRIYAGSSVFPLHCNMVGIENPGEPDDPEPEVPSSVTLYKPVPNPFNPRTTIAFDLTHPSRACIAAYDLRGRRVATLADQRFDAGHHSLRWQGTDDRGRPLPSGTYLVQFRTESALRTTKAVLVR